MNQKNLLTFIERKKKIAAAVVLIMCMCMLSLSGCHTVKGVGQDVKSAGEAIEDSSGK